MLGENGRDVYSKNAQEVRRCQDYLHDSITEKTSDTQKNVGSSRTMQSLNIHGKLSESAIDNNNDKDNAKQLENGDRRGEEDDHGG